MTAGIQKSFTIFKRSIIKRSTYTLAEPSRIKTPAVSK
ncbi:hypothetical protein PTET_a2783 [Pseudoalteromonas tetraodonis]|nr:hypothetical protein PTET_a2783 [Pseudoalteromonas tetraodonis]